MPERHAIRALVEQGARDTIESPASHYTRLKIANTDEDHALNRVPSLVSDKGAEAIPLKVTGPVVRRIDYESAVQGHKTLDKFLPDLTSPVSKKCCQHRAQTVIDGRSHSRPQIYTLSLSPDFRLCLSSNSEQ